MNSPEAIKCTLINSLGDYGFEFHPFKVKHDMYEKLSKRRSVSRQLFKMAAPTGLYTTFREML